VFAKDTAKILTGGADKNATVFNKDLEQVVAVLKGHSKKVNRVVYHPTEDTVITGSHDTTVRIWNVPTAQTIQVYRRTIISAIVGRCMRELAVNTSWL
jgi:pre-mRNA-processing factor 19